MYPRHFVILQDIPFTLGKLGAKYLQIFLPYVI
jgi:hypothetical protein